MNPAKTPDDLGLAIFYAMIGAMLIAGGSVVYIALSIRGYL
jgi:hypothetical protein